MGGKVWSEDEEHIFWKVVVPLSVGAANPVSRPLGWPECAAMMQDMMGANARRTYTHSMLYEHHYQCVNLSAKSPKAKKFVEKWKQDRVEHDNGVSCPPAPPSPEPAKQDDSYLDFILAHDPGAKQYLKNISVSRGSNGDSQTPVTSAPPVFENESNYQVAAGRDAFSSASVGILNASQGATFARSVSSDHSGANIRAPMDWYPECGQKKTSPVSNIDPALIPPVAQTSSSPIESLDPCASISSNSSLEKEEGDYDDRTMRSYRPPETLRSLAPALPRTVDVSPQGAFTPLTYATYVGSNFVPINQIPRYAKRFALPDFENEPAAKRRNVQMGPPPAHLDPVRRPQLTHWQRMGFRDEPRIKDGDHHAHIESQPQANESSGWSGQHPSISNYQIDPTGQSFGGGEVEDHAHTGTYTHSNYYERRTEDQANYSSARYAPNGSGDAQY